MSQVVASASQAAALDWNVTAAAIATFVGTLTITILGWFKARDRVKKQFSVEGGNPPVLHGAILQDNQSVRESTLASRELRDQLLLNNHALQNHGRLMEENTDTLDNILDELKKLRKDMRAQNRSISS